MISGQNLLAGQWSAQGNETFAAVDPRTKTEGSVRFFNATDGEIDRAVRQAADAFKTMRLTTAAARAAFLESAADEIEKLGAELIETADAETGLGQPRLESERGRTTSQLRLFADLLREGSFVEAIIDTALPTRTPTPTAQSSSRVRRLLWLPLFLDAATR